MRFILLVPVGMILGFASCSSTPQAMDAPLAVTEGSRMVAVPPSPGEAIRVAGTDEKVTRDDKGNYKASKVMIDTPLPEGYPAPTPPGAIEVKTYPSVRRAEVTGENPNPDRGMNNAFWPLFNHIKKHDIAMTSPVEMDYQGLESSRDAKPESWSMAFLYRTRDLNPTGQEGNVTVRDAEPVTVAAVGVRGDYGMTTMRRGMEQIEQWLAANPGWEAAGNWRMLAYNGPKLAYWNKWAEVQIPVRPVDPAR
jgi:hypothetical protein